MKTLLQAVYDELLHNGVVKSKTDLGEKLGVSRGRISQIISSSDTLPKTMQEKLNTLYGFSTLWLASNGKQGEMFTTSTPAPIRNEMFILGGWDYDDVKEETKGGNKYIDLGNGFYTLFTPLVSPQAQAGYLSGYQDAEYIEKLPAFGITVNELHKGKYISFVVRGDSMDDGSENAVKEKDIVTGRLVSPDLYANSKLHITSFDKWVIVHTEGILIKEIKAHDVAKGIITLHSYNDDKKEYPDRDIHLSEVREIYNVVQVSRPQKEQKYIPKTESKKDVDTLTENKEEPIVKDSEENSLNSFPHKTGEDMDMKSIMASIARADELRARAELVRENNYAALIEQIREGSLVPHLK